MFFVLGRGTGVLMVRHLLLTLVIAAILSGFVLAAPPRQPAPAPFRLSGSATSTPSVLGGGKIKHVVIIYQENHSFDNVLGRLCTQDHRCQGATAGKLHDGTVVPLTRASDLVVGVGHGSKDQTTAIDGGAMDGFDN